MPGLARRARSKPLPPRHVPEQVRYRPSLTLPMPCADPEAEAALAAMLNAHWCPARENDLTLVTIRSPGELLTWDDVNFNPVPNYNDVLQ